MATPTAATAENMASLRDVFGEKILDLGRRNRKIVMLDADLSASTRTGAFRKAYPDRALNIGIAEQNMVGIAAGIAMMGGIPFVNTFASFLTRRACDQIAISVAYAKLNVKLFGFHGGINLGEDGATQQAVEDLGIMQAIPGIRVYVPVDANDLRRVMEEVVDVDGPTYVRLARFPSPIFTPSAQTAGEHVADFEILRAGRDLLVLTTGTICTKVIDAAHALAKDGIQAQVVGITRIKPLGATLAGLFDGRPVAVVEEHNIHGGLAAGLSAFLDERGITHRLKRIGIQDRFGESGPPDALLEAFGLAGEPLVKALREAAGR